MRASALIFLIMKRQEFDVDACFAAALECSTRSEFCKKHSRAYNALWRRGLLDVACSHMTISDVFVPPKWDHELVFAEAAKYRTRAEFKKCCSGAHGYALKHKILEQACSHMRDGHRFWHIFELMAVAIKYTDKAIFVAQEKRAYDFCCKNGLIKIVCAHMAGRRDWSNKSDVLAEAARYSSRVEFQALASGAFKQAYAGGYLDEACAHMGPGIYGFQKEKPATLYQILITAPDGARLYKVGITNRAPERRLAGMGLDAGYHGSVIAQISFSNGRDARIVERKLHERFSGHRYHGRPIMKNGNTELFNVPLLEAD